MPQRLYDLGSWLNSRRSGTDCVSALIAIIVAAISILYLGFGAPKPTDTWVKLIIVGWALLPPVWFWFQYVFMFDWKNEDEKRKDRDWKLIEVSKNIWLGVAAIVFAIFTTLD